MLLRPSARLALGSARLGLRPAPHSIVHAHARPVSTVAVGLLAAGAAAYGVARVVDAIAARAAAAPPTDGNATGAAASATAGSQAGFFSSFFVKSFYEGGFEEQMTRHEAALILGVRETASREKIKEQHRLLSKQNHPDTGGSPYLAQKINEAKDLLLGNR